MVLRIGAVGAVAAVAMTAGINAVNDARILVSAEKAIEYAVPAITAVTSAETVIPAITKTIAYAIPAGRPALYVAGNQYTGLYLYRFVKDGIVHRIGISSRLASRLRQHVKTGKLTEEYKVFVQKLAPHATWKDATNAETRQILKHNPLLNEVGGGGGRIPKQLLQ